LRNPPESRVLQDHREETENRWTSHLDDAAERLTAGRLHFFTRLPSRCDRPEPESSWVFLRNQPERERERETQTLNPDNEQTRRQNRIELGLMTRI
jgi:hypothetical protein